MYIRGKDAVASMIKRLAHRNANVQLYTLEVRMYYENCVAVLTDLASECTLPELRLQNTQGACLEKLHGCYAKTCKRSSI